MSTTCSGNGMAFFPAAASFMLQTQPPQHGDTEIQDHHHPHHGHHPSTASLTSLLPSCSPHHQDFHGTVGGGDHHDMGQLPMLGKRSMSFPTGLEMCSSDHHHHHTHDYPGAAPNNGVGIGIGMGGGDEDLSEDDGSQLLGGGGGGVGEKKRRLSMEQVKTLEKNFELANKLEPDRKIQLAKALGLQPRQIAIWFQNRRARWKTKQLEKDYNILKRQFDALKSDNENLLSQNHKLQAQIMALKNGNREPTESINLNKENTTEGSASSDRSENSNSHHHHHQHDHHHHIKSDISRSTPPTPPPTIDDHDQQHNNIQLLSAAALHPTSTTTRTSMPLFPPSSNSSSTGLLREIDNENIIPHHLRLHMEAQQLSFHPSIMSNTSRPDHDDDLHDGHHQNKFDHHHHHHQSAATHHVKEENGTFSNMFVGMDDQSVFWPWLEQPN